ncbi:trypsin-like peptidase domain-containing protein [Candidatus Nomurabacteria bacterium]|nr:trypsin-like peptidase domain-containing protein [Candidatus Nomurabacteria bacterium]
MLKKSKTNDPILRIISILILICLLIIAFLLGRNFQTNNPSSSSQSQSITLEEDSIVIDIAEKISPSVVSIQTSADRSNLFGESELTPVGAGTGIVIDQNGLILTNRHVVSDADELTIYTSDGVSHPAELIDIDSFNDLAFIQAEGEGYTPAELGSSDQMKIGQQVIAIGNALGQFDNTVTTGIISGKGRDIVAGDGTGASSDSLSNLLQTDAAINSGNSGGPLLNYAGQVIGINTAVASYSENIGFAIPIDDAKGLVESIKAQGRIIRPYLGIRYLNLTPELAEQYDLNTSGGVLIRGDESNPGVLADSPAAKAGLESGDIIIKVDNQDIDQNTNLSSIINSHKVGDKIKLTIIRDNDEQELTVTLEEFAS